MTALPPPPLRLPTTQRMRQLVADVLIPVIEPRRALAMRAYMRDQFPFLGIATPHRRAAVKPLFQQLKGADGATLLGYADALWDLPEREYQYAALDLLATYVGRFERADIPALMSLARRASWWDTVDAMAGIIGKVLKYEHDGMDQALKHDDFWIRRIAVLHQLGWKKHTDRQRLFLYALALAHEKEFFIQKAIGWSLRDYARHEPEAVHDFLETDGQILSALSFREAGKHL